MAAEYDRFAAQYKMSKLLPFRSYVEGYTFFKMLGPLEGLTVLDLACGEGHYSRLIRQRGAARVVGVDLSSEMIALAEAEERRAPLGIEYRCSAAEDLGTIGSFDLVTAAFLLNCARTRERLGAMCDTIAANLKPGGRFVSINSNLGPGVPPDIAKYGWRAADSTPIEEGTPYRLTFLSGPEEFTVINVFYSHATYEEELRRAGFASVRWQPPEVSDEGVRDAGREFWQDLLESQSIVGIDCRLRGPGEPT